VNRHRLLLCLVLTAFFVPMSRAPSTAKPVAPIHVNRCHAQKLAVVLPGFDPAYYPAGPYYWNDVYGHRFIQPPVLDNPTLSIDFVNSTKKVARVVEFGLVARGHLIAEFRDAGTFSPGAGIKHTFGLHPSAYPLGTWHCVPLLAEFMDRTKWINPHLPSFGPSLYQ